MNMPRVKLIILMNGRQIWYPTEYEDLKNIREVWIEEQMTKAEFDEFRKHNVLLRNRK